ncbi:MAG: Gfo/Idh/MocA family oxidoreductase [Planctomycetota bacterium]
MTTATTSQPVRVKTPARPIRLAVVGMGERAAWMLKLMAKESSGLRIEAVVDPDIEPTRQRIKDNQLPIANKLRVLSDLEAFTQSGIDVDGVVVGTRCHLHTPLSIALSKTGLPIFLEKPVAISWAQLYELRKAFGTPGCGPVVVSFPLRRTPIFEAVHAIVRSGRLGTINQIQAINNVNYGNVYIDNWYRHYDLAGGLWLQKATHDFDYIHHLAGESPAFISAMHSKRVWQDPVLNQDAGSALVQYPNGIHASYSQNFLTRKTAGKRGATVTGEDGTVSFDWNTKSITVVSHNDERIENISIEETEGHGGGDQRLAQNFIEVIQKKAASVTPMIDGLISAATCLAARDAAHRRTVEPVPPQDDRGQKQLAKFNIEPPTDVRADD